jgi:hypothetical protein
MIPLWVGPEGADLGLPRAAVDYLIRGVLTNTMATGAYRGAGRPERTSSWNACSTRRRAS